MRLNKKHVKYMATILVIVFVIYMGVNFKEVDRVWTQWLKGETQSYYGTVNLWHINDDFSIKLPYSTMLKKYEKQNFGIFVNVEFLSPEEMSERIRQGDSPDIITYSRVPADLKESLETLEKVDIPFLNTGIYGKEIKAYPIFYDTYTLIINEELLNSQEDVPSVIEPDSILQNLSSFKFDDGVIPIGFSGWGAMANLLMAEKYENFPMGNDQAGLKDFEQGKVAAMVCSTLELEKYSGELPTYSSFDFGGFTDRVRFISVCNTSGNENRITCAKEIAGLFVSEKYQKQIGEYAFSITHGYSGVKSEENIALVNGFKNYFDNNSFLTALNEDKNNLMSELGKIMVNE